LPPGGEKYSAWYDKQAADAAVSFFSNYLRHTEAEWFGRPFHLEPWQEWDIIRPIFGWKRADGTRLIRQVLIIVPRKNGKTELAAGIALLVMLGDGEMGGQAYSMAVNKDQAAIVFEKAGVMVGCSERLREHLEVYKTSIFCPELMSSFKPLSKSPGSKHGFSPNFAIADELHEWPDGELHDVVHKGTAARRQPLEILITTAGEPGIGYGWELYEIAQNVLNGTVEDPTFLPIIYAADPEDDWTSPDTWKKANPNYGVSVKPDYLASEVAKAQGNERKISEFKRYHLNIWSDAVHEGVDLESWDACLKSKKPVRSVPLSALVGRRCFGAVDLSSVTDLTALCLVSPWPDNQGYDAWWMFWIPTHKLSERVKRDRVPFDNWIADGWIIGTEGNVVDYDAIRAFITGAVEHPLAPEKPLVEIVDLVEIAIDRWNATQITTQLTGDGVTVVPFGQGFASMSAPSKEFQRLVTSGTFNHMGNPVARWMATCTSFEADKRDNIAPVKPDRKKHKKRIDGIVTAIMALGRAIAPREDQEEKGSMQSYLDRLCR
jgi:phage terminase large subunit-like protein